MFHFLWFIFGALLMMKESAPQLVDVTPIDLEKSVPPLTI